MNPKHYYQQRILQQFEPLLHQSLRRLGMSPQHFDYEDYLQELRIKLLKIEEQFDGQPLANDDDRYRFTAYAQKGLYWFLVDLIRKLRRQVNEVKVTDFVMASWPAQVSTDSSIYLETFLKEVGQRLEEDDFRFFQLLVSGDWSITELADFYGVSRKTIYRWRQQLQDKLADLRFLLIKEGHTWE